MNERRDVAALTSSIRRIVAFCVRHAIAVTVSALLLGLAAGWFAAGHFAMNSNTADLISDEVGWRKQQARFEAQFPRPDNLILAVIDGATPERAEEAAASLASALARDPALFPSVRRPDAGAFLEHDGLLLLPTAEVKSATEKLIDAQPFLAALAGDPSLRGVMASLGTVLTGIEHGQASLARIEGPMTALADCFDQVLAGRPAFLSWQAMLTGGTPDPRRLRRFIEIEPTLDYGQLTPGRQATDAVRKAARGLGLTPENGVTVRLTGPVPLTDEEFGTLAERAGLMTGVMGIAVLAMLWLAVRSLRLIFAIAVTIMVGLATTTAFGLLTFGAFNVISVAFIALFVGLGVDFGIQLSVRYRAERHEGLALDAALAEAASGIGGALTLAAAAISIGFLSFLPTSYVGVAELGAIAGVGMIVTFALTVTLLPALLALMRPKGETREVGFTALAPLDTWLHSHYRRVLGTAAVLALASLAALPLVGFDFNPLDLRSAEVESVSTLLDLTKTPETSPNTIDATAPDAAQAEKLAARLEALPEVSHVLWVKSFVPDDQEEKLALIGDASMLLDTAVNPFDEKPTPSDADISASLAAIAARLHAAGTGDMTQAGKEALRLARDLDALANGTPALRARATEALIPGLKTMLAQIRGILQAAPVTLETLPADFRRDWVSPGGIFRLQVTPRGNSNDNEVLSRFTRAVRAVAPEATGTPISVQESGRTILRAFIEAGLWSFLAIAAILGFALRRARDVTLALLPLLLAGMLTLATCAVIGMPLNFANVIALPLLLGMGVAFDIYFMMAWRAGTRRLLQKPLTRAVLFSAATTAAGFGSLWLSSHPGTASMGKLLLISLWWILVCVLFVLPALFTFLDGRAGLDERARKAG
ncbi:MMPL family transporter [Parvibaculum sp.]|uniref:MMPL family transporter n=1 Tax=Parvibaculum sp. TaxID=2024848 RepID=UPI002BD90872|nr:MMPL family transporter [Parvibaculum sp.]HUD53155.1 MMPL family transporter [Parvibaculum sp.]